ncbi:MAG: SDR family NAD(P)-dependent oxidoreductase, partial [Actinobacteria bacterium]|nr:SDR family NAD(P)-dependent oxidoreductase [Actinomycetota bacterium]
MKANNYGRIINITSSNGAGASEFTSHYQAAKAAQHSFTKSCA